MVLRLLHVWHQEHISAEGAYKLLLAHSRQKKVKHTAEIIMLRVEEHWNSLFQSVTVNDRTLDYMTSEETNRLKEVLSF